MCHGRRLLWTFLLLSVLLVVVQASTADANHLLTELVSTGPASTNGAFDARFLGASNDSSRVFFETNERLVSGDTDGNRDIYMRSGGTTTLFSLGETACQPACGNGPFDADSMGIFADGTRVIFRTAESLVSADTDGSIDNYERSGTTIDLLPTSGGFVDASADATRVFFVTNESLVPEDTDEGYGDIYEYSGGTTTLVSTGDISCTPSAFDCDSPSFMGASQDGTRVFFRTGEKLSSLDTDGGFEDIYERSGGSTFLVSADDGVGDNGFNVDIFHFQLSQDGTHAFFETQESLISESEDHDFDFDIYEYTGGVVRRVSTGPGPDDNAQFGNPHVVGLSADGTRVFFRTYLRLVSSDMDSRYDIYERSGGTTTTLISTGPTGGNGDFDSDFKANSADGSIVLFETGESLLGTADPNGGLYSRSGATTTLISSTGGFIAASQDGRRVFFTTVQRLVSHDTDNDSDLYERFAGTTTLVAPGYSGLVGLSQDGTRFFLATGEKLLSTDTDGTCGPSFDRHPCIDLYGFRTPVGKLTPLAGTAGCVSETGTAGACVDGKALGGPTSAAVSPDGKNVYVASLSGDSVAVLQRNTATGQLTQSATTAGCISETGSGGACADGKALDGPASVAVSPDGKNVYVASQVSDAVAVLQRDATTGQLTQPTGTAGCISETGSAGACADGKALDGPAGVAVSPDNKSVYVGSQVSDAVAVLQRDTSSGQLTQPATTAGCISETGSAGACADGKALDGPDSVAVTPDGKGVYVASEVSDAVAAIKRNTTSGFLTQPATTAGCVSETGTAGACADGKALDGAAGVAVSPDNKSVYVASAVSDAIAALRRNTLSGQLTQLTGTGGCVSETGTAGACADGKALDGARSVAVTAGGDSVYVASEVSDAVAAFRRNVTTFGLTQLTGKTGCVSETGTAGACTDGKALDGARSVAVSGDGKNAYAASFVSNAVAAFKRS